MRPLSIRAASLVCLVGGAGAYVAFGLGACLSGDIVDLGTDFDSVGIVPDTGPRNLPEAGTVHDASADRTEASAILDGGDASEASDVHAEADAMDEAPPPQGDVCLMNPSFERPVADAQARPAGDAQVTQPLTPNPPQWLVCAGSMASTSSCGLQPTEGDSYVGLSVGLAPLLNDPTSIDTTLCAPLEVGFTYSLTVDFGLDEPITDAGFPGEPPSLQILGSSAACTRKELLWRSPSLPNACIWRKFCMSFTPAAEYTHLLLVPETSSSSALSLAPTYVIVDNLVSTHGCP